MRESARRDTSAPKKKKTNIYCDNYRGREVHSPMQKKLSFMHQLRLLLSWCVLALLWAVVIPSATGMKIRLSTNLPALPSHSDDNHQDNKRAKSQHLPLRYYSSALVTPLSLPPPLPLQLGGGGFSPNPREAQTTILAQENSFTHESATKLHDDEHLTLIEEFIIHHRCQFTPHNAMEFSLSWNTPMDDVQNLLEQVRGRLCRFTSGKWTIVLPLPVSYYERMRRLSRTSEASPTLVPPASVPIIAEPNIQPTIADPVDSLIFTKNHVIDLVEMNPTPFASTARGYFGNPLNMLAYISAAVNPDDDIDPDMMNHYNNLLALEGPVVTQTPIPLFKTKRDEMIEPALDAYGEEPLNTDKSGKLVPEEETAYLRDYLRQHDCQMKTNAIQQMANRLGRTVNAIRHRIRTIRMEMCLKLENGSWALPSIGLGQLSTDASDTPDEEIVWGVIGRPRSKRTPKRKFELEAPWDFHRGGHREDEIHTLPPSSPAAANNRRIAETRDENDVLRDKYFQPIDFRPKWTDAELSVVKSFLKRHQGPITDADVAKLAKRLPDRTIQSINVKVRRFRRVVNS